MWGWCTEILSFYLCWWHRIGKAHYSTKPFLQRKEKWLSHRGYKTEVRSGKFLFLPWRQLITFCKPPSPLHSPILFLLGFSLSPFPCNPKKEGGEEMLDSEGFVSLHLRKCWPSTVAHMDYSRGAHALAFLQSGGLTHSREDSTEQIGLLNGSTFLRWRRVNSLPKIIPTWLLVVCIRR